MLTQEILLTVKHNLILSNIQLSNKIFDSRNTCLQVDEIPDFLTTCILLIIIVFHYAHKFSWYSQFYLLDFYFSKHDITNVISILMTLIRHPVNDLSVSWVKVILLLIVDATYTAQLMNFYIIFKILFANINVGIFRQDTKFNLSKTNQPAVYAAEYRWLNFLIFVYIMC